MQEGDGEIRELKLSMRKKIHAFQDRSNLDPFSEIGSMRIEKEQPEKAVKSTPSNLSALSIPHFLSSASKATTTPP